MLKKSTQPLKSTGKVKYYDNNWNGNQYIKTINVFDKKLTKGLTKYTPWIGTAINATDIAIAIYEDEGIGANTATTATGIAGSMGGAWAGGWLLATAGTFFCPGLGTVIGYTIGVGLGSFFGGYITEEATRPIYEDLFNTKDMIKENKK